MNFKAITALKITMNRIRARSVLLATVNSTFDIATSGSLGDSIKVYVDPLTNLQTRVYQDTAVGTPRNKYVRDRLAKNFVNVNLGDQLYAAFGANGFDTIDFADEQANNYATFTTQMGDQIAAQIDTSLAGEMNGITTAEAVDLDIASSTVDALDDAQIASRILRAIQRQVDALYEAGVPGDYIIAAHPSVTQRVSVLLEKYSYTGDAANVALRNNIVGNLYNAAVIKVAKLAVDSVVVYTKDAFVVAGRPSGKSSGAKQSEVFKDSSGTIALTANLSFDPDYQEDVLVVSTFATIETLDATRARKIVFSFPAN